MFVHMCISIDRYLDIFISPKHYILWPAFVNLWFAYAVNLVNLQPTCSSMLTLVLENRGWREARGRKQGSTGEDEEKRIETCYVHVPTQHNECSHYVLQNALIKNKNLRFSDILHGR